MDFSVSPVAILRGILGLSTLVTLCWLLSYHRKNIPWSLVIKALSVQLVFAIAILKIPIVANVFSWLSRAFVKVISFSQDGAKFLFASFNSGIIEQPLLNFAIQVLPTIVFFSALSSLLYYLGVLQKVVYGLAWLMKKIMPISGAESLSTAGNIFLGQTEAPLLIKPYLNNMTRSELFCMMTGGMATIAGGVLAAYIGFLGGDNIEQQIYFAKHLLAASVMSAPATIMVAKIILPEKEEFEQSMEVAKDKLGSNVLEAIANGTTDGLKLAINVAAMLLVFIALMSLGNALLGDVLGRYTGINDWIAANTTYTKLSFQFILGYALAPLVWLLGICTADMFLIAQLLGEKTILNEFVAYVSLGGMKTSNAFAETKSIVMATYILCGFANFASIGIQIGGIGNLAPNRKSVLAQLAFKAMLAGTIASLFTAVIVGMLL